MKKLGLIAGNGQFPILFAQAARESGVCVVAIAHTGESDPTLAHVVDEIHWVEVGQLGDLIAPLKQSDITDVVMAGGVKKVAFFNASLDARARSLLQNMGEKKDDALLRAFAGALEAEGMQVRSPTDYVPSLLADLGEITRPLTQAERLDVQWGWPLAKAVGRLDIGQCIVVQNGILLAVEAVEGTDAAIRRGGALCPGGAVVIKCCKPQQDLRFDMPVVGPNTISAMADVGASALAIEAKKTLLLERPRLLSAAHKSHIAVVGYNDEAIC